MKQILFAAIVTLSVGVCQVQAGEKDFLSRIRAYQGRSFTGLKSSEYISYDIALRNYMVERIQRRFGVSLDPNKYSGFELLEIESLFRCKKSAEPFDLFLKGFPKQF